MELREIITFLEVARQNSFSKAAGQLGYSQAAVTIQIRQLEQELNVRLFDRIGKQTTMTYQGKVFYEYAAEIVRGLELAKQAMTKAGNLNGELSIGTVESVCASIFPDLLQKFHCLHPQVKIRIMIDTPEKLLDKMDRNELDLVYLLDRQIYDTAWRKALEEAETVSFIVSAEHELGKKKSVKLEEVIGEPFLLTEKDVSYRLMLDQFLAAQGKEIVPFLEIGNTDSIIRQLVNNKEGVTFLPEFTVRSEIEKGKLRRVSVKDFHMQVWRQILYHKDKWMTREMEEFIQMARCDNSRSEESGR